jgi:hypothetical protein
VNLTAIGGFGGLAIALVSVVLAIIGFRAKRKDAQVQDLIQVRDLHVISERWRYRVQVLAASRGWDTDPDWPATPIQLTAEFQRAQAKVTDNHEVLDVLDRLGKLTKGGKDD